MTWSAFDGLKRPCEALKRGIRLAMVTLSEIHEQAMQLPSAQRASLAADLLGSLEPVLMDADDGVEEALKRDAELDADPSLEMTLDELRAALGR